ncbi:hypothetical protein ACJJTC_018608 [Scirpophaga incertulas]
MKDKALSTNALDIWWHQDQGLEDVSDRLESPVRLSWIGINAIWAWKLIWSSLHLNHFIEWTPNALQTRINLGTSERMVGSPVLVGFAAFHLGIWAPTEPAN